MAHILAHNTRPRYCVVHASAAGVLSPECDGCGKRNEPRPERSPLWAAINGPKETRPEAFGKLMAAVREAGEGLLQGIEVDYERGTVHVRSIVTIEHDLDIYGDILSFRVSLIAHRLGLITMTAEEHARDEKFLANLTAKSKAVASSTRSATTGRTP